MGRENVRIKRYGRRRLGEINTASTGEIKWGTGGEGVVKIWCKGRGDTEDGVREE